MTDRASVFSALPCPNVRIVHFLCVSLTYLSRSFPLFLSEFMSRGVSFTFDGLATAISLRYNTHFRLTRI